MSASPIMLSNFLTGYPYIEAYKAQIGSISVITTRAPQARIASAHPFPTSPNPQITVILPAIITSVALMIPSGNECLHPYTLSNLDLVTESFTLIAGNNKVPTYSRYCNLCTPVVVSSETPRHYLAQAWKVYLLLDCSMVSLITLKISFSS